ncbi:MAG: tRNA preQ1(34) S-adenosylmethionine ribosyltransferase-isomerase QueA [Deltaproteobacteria bacterium]|nr:tRNA preQ1(34) S-adenosylmethionine ribosyltransferase-isomerase QueA [Deltaproteobacteria bacterium]
MDIKEFDYNLPKELIAQFPQEKRDESRLMIAHRDTGKIGHKRFFEITDYLKCGDVLVLNNTRVIPARLYGKKSTSGEVEVFLLEQQSSSIGQASCLSKKNIQIWKCLIGNSKGIRQENIIEFEDSLKARIIAKNEDGSWLVEFFAKGDIKEVINKIGIMPLPPYIKRVRSQKPALEGFNRGSEVREMDIERYQTVFAKKDGAVAAPTAGLHFTDELLTKIKSIGVEVLYITLHTGWGTFKPVKVQDITKHRMMAEYYEISPNVFEAIKNAHKENRRIIAVGTTATRTLESCVRTGWESPNLKGYTDLFIYPGFKFKVMDAMVTNFHLPKSTLFMLVCAFAGRDFIMKSYKLAIEDNYRFFSYGDAMMIL